MWVSSSARWSMPPSYWANRDEVTKERTTDAFIKPHWLYFRINLAHSEPHLEQKIKVAAIGALSILKATLEC